MYVAVSFGNPVQKKITLKTLFCLKKATQEEEVKTPQTHMEERKISPRLGSPLTYLNTPLK